MKSKLQIALDTINLLDAVDLAAKIASALSCEDIWFEAGTPLIKSWGKIAVKALKEATNCFTVADAKIMDVGSIESELFFKAGADAVTVLGVADNETIREVLEKARECGKIVIVDLINYPKPYERALELADMGVDVILYHVGVDVQKKRGITATALLEEVEKLKRSLKCKIAIAGGIKHGDASVFAKIGVDVIVVGSAIIRAENPVESARLFLQELERAT